MAEQLYYVCDLRPEWRKKPPCGRLQSAPAPMVARQIEIMADDANG